MRVRSCAAVVLLVIVASACGSGSSSGSSTTTTQRNPTRDRDLAQRALVTAEDLPAGWLAADAAGAGPMALMDPANLDPVAECLDVPSTKLVPRGAVTQTSPVFQGPDRSTVQSRTMVVASPAQAAGSLATLGTKAFASCVEKRLEEGLQQPLAHPVLARDLSVSAIDASPLTWPTYGDGSRAVRIRTTLIGAEQGLDLYLQLVFITRGRSVATLAFTSSREPFPLDQAQNLSLVVSNRLPE
jgi:hypothetical protein